MGGDGREGVECAALELEQLCEDVGGGVGAAEVRVACRQIRAACGRGGGWGVRSAQMGHAIARAGEAAERAERAVGEAWRGVQSRVADLQMWLADARRAGRRLEKEVSSLRMQLRVQLPSGGGGGVTAAVEDAQSAAFRGGLVDQLPSVSIFASTPGDKAVFWRSMDISDVRIVEESEVFVDENGVVCVR